MPQHPYSLHLCIRPKSQTWVYDKIVSPSPFSASLRLKAHPPNHSKNQNLLLYPLCTIIEQTSTIIECYHR